MGLEGRQLPILVCDLRGQAIRQDFLIRQVSPESQQMLMVRRNC
jgi:hypothetical protein